MIALHVLIGCLQSQVRWRIGLKQPIGVAALTGFLLEFVEGNYEVVPLGEKLAVTALVVGGWIGDKKVSAKAIDRIVEID